MNKKIIIGLLSLFAIVLGGVSLAGGLSKEETIDNSADMVEEIAQVLDDDGNDVLEDSEVGSVAMNTLDSEFDTSFVISNGLWSENVTVTVNDGSFNFVSDGIPSHELPDQYVVPISVGGGGFADQGDAAFEVLDTEAWLLETPLDVDITTKPVYSETSTPTNLGQIGVVISGAQMFNDYENMELSVVAVDDNKFIDDAAFLDSCNGHALQQGNGYHYHGIPYCITDNIDEDQKHSTMVGVMLDGFPLYGNKDEGGLVINDAELDECGGHFGVTPEFPQGIYHYHLTDDEAPYSIDCFHGEIEYSSGGMQGRPGAGDPMQGVGPDLSVAAQTLGVSESELEGALQSSMPPDFDKIAEELGVDVNAVREALAMDMPPRQ